MGIVTATLKLMGLLLILFSIYNILLVSEHREALIHGVKPGEVEEQVFIAINQERQERGLPTLRLSKRVSDIARNHSRYMAEREELSHDNFEERKWKLIYYNAIGETVTREMRGWSAREVAYYSIKSWIESPGHRDIILSPRYHTVGIGAVEKGADWYITAIFVG